MASIPIKDQNEISGIFVALASKRKREVYTLYFEFALLTALRVSDNVHIRTMKTGLERVVVLNESCRKSMENYLEDKNEEDLIFPFKRQWIHKLLKWAANYSGLNATHISCLTTRKTADWRFYSDSNHDIMKTMYLLGHRSPKKNTILFSN